MTFYSEANYLGLSKTVEVPASVADLRTFAWCGACGGMDDDITSFTIKNPTGSGATLLLHLYEDLNYSTAGKMISFFCYEGNEGATSYLGDYKWSSFLGRRRNWDNQATSFKLFYNL